MAKPEICIFFSDQHDARIIGAMGNPVIRTPNLNKLIEAGTSFSAAYTSYPLCVPARMSFLTGQLPSHTGITTNQCTIPEDKTTFMHSLALTGYDTILCGRMHFVGLDQRHGFTQRLVGDQTPVLWHRSGIDEERGAPFAGTYGHRGCTRTIGYGNSPVLEYDRDVGKSVGDHRRYLYRPYEHRRTCRTCRPIGRNRVIESTPVRTSRPSTRRRHYRP